MLELIQSRPSPNYSLSSIWELVILFSFSSKHGICEKVTWHICRFLERKEDHLELVFGGNFCQVFTNYNFFAHSARLEIKSALGKYHHMWIWRFHEYYVPSDCCLHICSQTISFHINQNSLCKQTNQAPMTNKFLELTFWKGTMVLQWLKYIPPPICQAIFVAPKVLR